jgi:histidinol-phosphate aminotransferase
VKLPFEPNLIAQLGAVGALEDRPHLERTLQNNEVQYKRTMEFLTKTGFFPIPSLTNFVTFKTGSGEASDWLFEKLLDQGVIIRALKANEMPDFVRVSIGTPQEMDHFFESMEKIAKEFFNTFKGPFQ